jgi:hypothetical protein
MGLKCLLGHDFGPSGVVREHEEDGSEMVVTEREIRRCRRCGEEQVLSESTEVRAIRSEDDVGMERRDADAVATASDTQGLVDAGDADSPVDAGDVGDVGDPGAVDPPATDNPDAVHPTADGAAPSAFDDADHAPAAAGDDDSNTSLIERAEEGFDDPAEDPESDDGVILDETDEDEPRGHGEWPDSGDVGEPAAGSGPALDADGGHSSHSGAADGTDIDTDGPAETAADHDGASGDDADDGSAAERSVAETAAEEDAELLDAGGDDGATHGGTDTTDTGGTDGATNGTTGSAWPDPGGEDEGFAAESATSGGPSIAYGNTIAPQSANGTGGRNGQSHDDGYETSYLEKAVEERDGDGTIVSAGESVSGRSPGVETEYYCPNCDLSRPLDSSLRTGDICPECQRGYIAERER